MKPKFLLCIYLFYCFTGSAQVAGPNNPNSFSNAFLEGSSQHWTDIKNVKSLDGAYATFGNLAGASDVHTDYLMVTDFGFLIPAGTTIEGIKVEVNCADPNTRTSDYSVRIVKKGFITGEEKASWTPYPAVDDYMSYGGPTDLWGETWNYKFINDNQFGVVIAAQRNNYDGIPTDGRVDHIRITVYYSFTTLPVTLTSFTATAQNKTVALNWRTASENNIDNYQLERSANGRNFHPLASIPGLNIMGANYNYTDISPLPGVSYYRLNILGNAGYQKYSQTVSVKSGKENLITIFPTIWHQGEDMNVTNDNKEKLSINFFNASGQLIATTKTDTKLVPTETLANRSGLIYFKIMDDNKNELGAGHLLIY